MSILCQKFVLFGHKLAFLLAFSEHKLVIYVLILAFCGHKLIFEGTIYTFSYLMFSVQLKFYLKKEIKEPINLVTDMLLNH